MEILIIILFGLLGRLWGSDQVELMLFNKNWKKPLVAICSGLLFFPNPIMSGVVTFGVYVGQTLRDSIFDLLIGWDTKMAIAITYRALSFLPLMLGAYYIIRGLVIEYSLVWCVVPVLSRAPIQYLCGFLPLRESAAPYAKWYKKFFLNQAAMYEFIWCCVIGLSIVRI